MDSVEMRSCLILLLAAATIADATRFGQRQHNVPLRNLAMGNSGIAIPSSLDRSRMRGKRVGGSKKKYEALGAGHGMVLLGKRGTAEIVHGMLSHDIAKMLRAG